MKENPHLTPRLRQAVAACGTVASLTAVLSLLGRIGGWRVLEGFVGLYVSMDPHNAAAVVALGATLAAVTVWPGDRLVAGLGVTAGIGVALVGVTSVILPLIGPSRHLGVLVLSATGHGSGSPEGGISPITACGLLLAGTATALIARSAMPSLAVGIGMVVLASGCVMVLGYVYGTPLLYDTPIRPASLPASISSVSLGLGLTLAAGTGVWPVRLLTGPTIRAKLLRIFLPFTLAAIVASDLAILLFVRQTPANPALVSAATTFLCLLVAGALVSRAGTAVGNSIDRTEAELRRSENDLVALSRRLVEVQETERRNLSRELHDRVGQTLTALGINLTMVRHQPGADLPESMASRVDESIELLDQIGGHVEDLMNELRPPMLDEYGLPAALGWAAEQFMRRTGIATELDAPTAPDRRLSADAETGLFRMVQEALNNAAKHAQARHVTIEVREQEDSLAVAVTDDGVGFDLAGPRPPGSRPGYGLVTMRERARSIGGTLEVHTQPGRGTRVTVRVQFPAEA